MYRIVDIGGKGGCVSDPRAFERGEAETRGNYPDICEAFNRTDCGPVFALIQVPNINCGFVTDVAIDPLGPKACGRLDRRVPGKVSKTEKWVNGQ